MNDQGFDSILRDRSIGVSSIFVLLALIIGCTILSSLLSGALWVATGIDLNNVLQGEALDEDKRNFFRLGLMINHIGTFLVPAVLFCGLFIKKDKLRFLRLDRKPDLSSLLHWGLVILFSYPIIAQLTQWNLSIPLPEWMQSSQANAFALLKQTLVMNSLGEFIISIILIGILAAVGEELVFRGIVLEKLTQAWHNPHLAIFVSSIIFGGFHMQFERLLPLSVLGLILAYSYYYSKSLWVPIILHFINNSLQVLSIFIVTRQGEIPKIDEIPSLPWTLVTSSFILTLLLAYRASKIGLSTHESRS